jgi:hypothetical protein
LTAEGKVAKIRTKMMFPIKNLIYNIKSIGHTEGIYTTADHPLLIARPKNVKRSDKGYECPVCLKSFKQFKSHVSQKNDEKHKKLREGNIFEYLRLQAHEVVVGDYLVEQFNRKIEFGGSKELARLIGWFAAEGSYHRQADKTTLAGIEFSLNISEDDYAAEIIALAKKVYGDDLNCHIWKRPNKTIQIVNIRNKQVAEDMMKYCGQYSHEKKLSEEVMNWFPEIQLELLSAYLNGDGHFRANSCQGIDFSTVSQDLVYQMQTIAYRNNILMNVTHGKIRQNQYAKERKLYYVGYIPKQDVNKLPTSTKYKLIDGNETETYDINHAPSGKVVTLSRYKAQRKKITEKGILTPITSIILRDFEGIVYNLEIDDETHTYIADGISNFNCQVAYSNCSVCGHAAKTTKDYCFHVKMHKGGAYDGRPVYEENHGVEFIEVSFVTTGADAQAKVLEIIAKQARITNTDVRQLWAAAALDSSFIEKIHESQKNFENIITAELEAVKNKVPNEFPAPEEQPDPEEQGAMIKTDQGDVKDVETPSDKIETPEKVITIKIQALIEEAAFLKSAGLDNSIVLSELDRWSNHYKNFKLIAMEKEFETLVAQAEQELANSIDCTATLEKAERIKTILAGKGKFFAPKEKKNPNVIELEKPKAPSPHKMQPDELQDHFKANRGTGAHKNKKDKRVNNPKKQNDEW